VVAVSADATPRPEATPPQRRRSDLPHQTHRRARGALAPRRRARRPMTGGRHQVHAVDPSSALATAVAASTVVVVDDTAANVTLLERQRLLASAGITRVHGFTDPRKAMSHCAGALPDLVLLDLHMPHLDEFAVMEVLRSIVPTGSFLPVLVLTSDIDRDVKERALAAGAKDFLTKPFDRTEVAAGGQPPPDARPVSLARTAQRRPPSHPRRPHRRRTGGCRGRRALPSAHRFVSGSRRAHDDLPTRRGPHHRRRRRRRGPRPVLLRS
jgi:CheY-like chemotaxis protein